MNNWLKHFQDGRNVWLNGEKVENLIEHDAFKGTIQTISTLMREIEERDEVGFWNETLNQHSHKAFLIPKTLEDLQQRKAAFQFWSKKTYGVMSRLSDYAYSLITGYYIDRFEFDVYDPEFSRKIEKYFHEVQTEKRLVTTAIADPQIDRSKPIEERDEDAILRIVKETDEGVVIRGAKMIATGAPYVDDVIINTPFKDKEREKTYANFFIVPVNSKGLQIICRDSYACTDIEKYPLSSQYDEMDAVLIFDDVLVSWDRVFIHGSAEGVTKAHRHQQLNSLAHHQTVVRLLVKLQFIAGVATAIAESIGANHFLHVQEKLGELYTQIDSIEALLISAEVQGKPSEKGIFLPDSVPLQVARNLGTHYYGEALQILKQIGAGGYTQLPSTLINRYDQSLIPLLEKYYKGVSVDAKTKTTLLRIGWELIGSTLGTRHDLYERYYTGDPVRINEQFFENYDKKYLEKRLENFFGKYKIQEELYEHETTI
ncbi:4-hydroxyphenylacetate 3-hydroxylase family protein [Rummeliibacillus pycnus]|uniref:4-hydroxyphenylacetate 3-hydroxylase family protein n=1 Tax=Rummeliibacillus pycnus TaxID=101070 RepID=UPI000C9C0D05|nr:4-hydroxyphenylacetate 3-hydroxylase N-terminal domain-containing protein [Rummeliibacillus pycnus]